MADAQRMTHDGRGIALELTALTKTFGSHRALDGASLSIAAGECVAIVGESGSGKTTMLRCINRLVDGDSGVVKINGQDVREIDATVLRRSLGYVPQDGGLMPHWRVIRNAALVPWLSGMSDSTDRAVNALRTVGLDPDEIGDRWPHELSGGQRQRVAMARALAASQRCLLLDEPFGALDAITRAELQRAFRKIRDESRVTAVLVTHDLREAMFLSDRTAVMHKGRIEQVGTASELRDNPATSYVAELLSFASDGDT
jgi:ABC-type proline/glycine betaine transport systems, ATPase components